MDQERIMELANDEAFLKKLADVESPEELQKVFAEIGIDATVEEINQVMDGEQELDADELDEVSGGLYTEIGVLIFMIGLYHGLKCNKKSRKK